MKKTGVYKLYGIPNCNTVKKVRDYLENQGIKYEFIDFKKSPPTKDLINCWKKFSKDWPVNTKGPTFRKIKAEFVGGTDIEKMNLLLENSSAIKRPILEHNDVILAIGFDLTVYK